jgi:hypothetical protein
LSDGGHFEDLGLYEMVLRRCGVIIVVDGSRDTEFKFTDLGNAVRKTRIDLGIPIEFDFVPIGERGQIKDGKNFAIGRIRYGCIDKGATDGVLIYIKAAFYGEKEPRDVFNYAKTHADFPHETTADQFFDEPQFESYRALGSYTVDQMLGDGHTPLTLYSMVEEAVKRSGRSGSQLSWLDKWLKPNT